MEIEDLQDMAHTVNSRSELVHFLDLLGKSIVDGEAPTLTSYEVMDGCENFAANLHAWCAYRNIPFEEQPTWSLVAWIILAGALND